MFNWSWITHYMKTCPKHPKAFENARKAAWSLDFVLKHLVFFWVGRNTFLEGIQWCTRVPSDKSEKLIWLHPSKYPLYSTLNHWTKHRKETTGWWFGTFLLFFLVLGMSSSQLNDSYFSEGLFPQPPTVHQLTKRMEPELVHLIGAPWVSFCGKNLKVSGWMAEFGSPNGFRVMANVVEFATSKVLMITSWFSHAQAPFLVGGDCNMT